MKKIINLILFFSFLVNVTAQEEMENKVYSSALEILEKGVQGDLYRTSKIYFKSFINCEFDSLKLQETEEVLDSLYFILTERDTLKIEIGVHMAARFSSNNSDSYICMPKLIQDYLIIKGIKKDRLIIINYKNREPFLVLTEEEKKSMLNREILREEYKNKRVEFKIL